MSHDSITQIKIKNSRASLVQFLAAFVALLGALCTGLVLSFTSPAIPSMQNEIVESVKSNLPNSTFNESSKEMFLGRSDTEAISWIISIICIGALIGSLNAGNIIDSIGHRKFLCFSSLICIAGWILIYFANSIMMVILGRFITGFSVGLLSTSVSVYVVEISTIRSRGFLGCSFQGFITLGLLLNTVGGMFVDFRMLSLICCVPPALIILLIFLFPESPYWLIKKNREKDALNALKRLRSNSTNCNLELDQIKDTILNSHLTADGDSLSIDQESIANNTKSKGSTEFIVKSKKIKLNKTIEQNSNRSSFLRDLRLPHVYKPLLIGTMVIMFFQQMSCKNGLFASVEFILKSADFDLIDERKAAFIVSICFSVFAWSSTFFVNLFGRRTLLMISSVGYIFGYLFLGLFYYAKEHKYNEFVKQFNFIPLIVLIVFFFVHAIGYGSLCWFCINEFSISYRNQIASICTCMNWLMCFVVMKNFIPLLEYVGWSTTFFFFVLVGIASLTCVILFVPETKNKTNQEIKRLFYKK